MAHLVSKSKFAEMQGVTAGRVSQWIAEGKLSAALVGEGRYAQIDADKAVELLRGSLDVGQVLGQGRPLPSAASALPLERQPPASSDAPPPRAPSPAPSLPTGNDDAARIQRAKAEQAEISAERDRRRINEERGLYVLAASAAAEFRKSLGALVAAVESWATDSLATQLATAFADAAAEGRVLDKRAIAILVRAEFRKFRAARAARAAERRDGLARFEADEQEAPPAQE